MVWFTTQNICLCFLSLLNPQERKLFINVFGVRDTTLVLRRCMGLLSDTHNCGLCMRRVCRERFPTTQVSDPDMHQGTCVTHVPWCMSGSLTSGFLWNRWRGKRSRHSRRIRNPQFPYLVRGPWITKLHVTVRCIWTAAPLENLPIYSYLPGLLHCEWDNH